MKSYRLSELAQEAIEDLCRRNPITDSELMETCRETFAQVATDVDEALLFLSERLDGVTLNKIHVSG